MIEAETLRVAGYICIIMAVAGFITNLITFSVLISNNKLRKQVPTVIILFLTFFDIFYNGIVQPLHAATLW